MVKKKHGISAMLKFPLSMIYFEMATGQNFPPENLLSALMPNPARTKPMPVH